VALMGAELQLQSTPGQGSRFFFTITLPVGAPRSSKQSALPASHSQALRVLIIDDHPIARDVLQRTCQWMDWVADTCEGGSAALELLQNSAQNGTTYQAIFVDWRMPGMDGWQTIHAIRESNLVAKTTVIAMVTGTGRETLLQRSESDQALVNDFLVKPITADMLLSTVLKASRSDKGPHAVKPMANAPRLTNMRLLVVEDNVNNQQVARELLQGEGAIVRVANDGQAGVNAIANAKQPFDLVLMDLQMPVMDGFEATGIIREEMELRALPIVAMTANALTSDREACLAAGMNEHIGKPFDLNELVRVLREQAGWPAIVEASTSTDVTLPDHVLHSAAAAQVDIQAAL
jgi:CheY-like chemotaxis protein